MCRSRPCSVPLDAGERNCLCRRTQLLVRTARRSTSCARAHGGPVVHGRRTVHHNRVCRSPAGRDTDECSVTGCLHHDFRHGNRDAQVVATSRGRIWNQSPGARSESGHPVARRLRGSSPPGLGEATGVRRDRADRPAEFGRGRTKTGRLWVYVRDDLPAGCTEPPAAWYHFSPDRKSEQLQSLSRISGILQARVGGGQLVQHGSHGRWVVMAICSNAQSHRLARTILARPCRAPTSSNSASSVEASSEEFMQGLSRLAIMKPDSEATEQPKLRRCRDLRVLVADDSPILQSATTGLLATLRITPCSGEGRLRGGQSRRQEASTTSF